MPLAHRESVFLLDTYEKVRQSSDEDFRSWLEDELLEKIIAKLPAWRILLAGRENLPYRADRHHKNTLRHWTEAESRHFLTSYGLTDIPLHRAIFNHCQGHPLLTDYARDVWEQGKAIDRPLTPDDLLHDINQEAAAHWLQKLLLQRLPEPLRSGLEAAALLRYLSLDALNSLLPDEQHLSRDDFSHLLDFSFIQKVPGEASRVHDLIRQTEDAWYRKTEFYRECHKQALQYYSQLSDTVPPDDKIPDQLFHYLALDQAEAMKAWRQEIDQRRLRYDLAGQTSLLVIPRLPERWPRLTPGEQADWFFHNGLLAIYQDRLREAEETYNQALPLYQQIEDRLGEANKLMSLGDLYVRQARLREAEEAYNQALPLYQQIEDRLGEANTRKSLGQLRSAQDRVTEAEDLFAQALEIYEAIGDHYSIVATFIYRGQHRLRHGRLEGFADWSLALPLSMNVDVHLFRQALGIVWFDLVGYLQGQSYMLLAQGIASLVDTLARTTDELALNEEQQGMVNILDGAFRVVGAISASHLSDDAEQQAQLAEFARDTAEAIDQATESSFALLELVNNNLP
jgi:tetratricopeptide (TPR) repeat protein